MVPVYGGFQFETDGEEVSSQPGDEDMGLLFLEC
jgi:hypothetical protein